MMLRCMKFRIAARLLLPGCFVCACRAGVTVFHIFTRPINGINPDGANPAAGLVLSGGVLCGTTLNGGLQGAGTAFYLNPDASGFNVIRAFANPPDPGNPRGAFAVSGNHFFVTSFGGGTTATGAIVVAQASGIA